MGCIPKLVLLLLVLVVVIYVVVQMLFPTAKVKAEIEKRVSKSIGRTVELDDVSLSIFPKLALKLKGLRVYNPEDFPAGEMVSIDNLSCGLKLWPLLKKQFVFDEITVNHPVLKLYVARDGKTNFDFEIDAGEEGIETPLGKKEKLSSEEAAMSAFAFDWAEIKNGDLIYDDDSSDIHVVLSNFGLETQMKLDANGYQGYSKGTLKLPSVKANMLPENLPLEIEVAYNADVDFRHADLVLKKTSLKVNGIPFEVESTVRNFLDLQSVFAKLHADGVDLEPLLDYIPPSENLDRSKLRLAGKLSGDIEARLEFGSDRQTYFSGNLDLDDLTVGYINIANRVNFENLHLDFDADTVSFKSRGGQMAERPFSLSGKVKNWDELTFAVATEGVYSLAGALPFLDPAYKHDLSGNLIFNILLEGQASKPADVALFGTAQVDNVYYNNDSLTSPLNRLDMLITFERKGATINSMYVEYPGVQMHLTGTLKNGFAHFIEPDKGHKKPYLDFKMNAPLVNYDILFPDEEIEAAAAGATGIPASGEAQAPILLPDIEAGGKVVIDTLITTGVEITNITADVTYKDGIIKYRNGEGNLYTGSISSEGQIDINDLLQPQLAISFTGKNIEANDFMARFANLDGHLYGKMDINGTLTGRGSEMEDFIRTINADGDLSMLQGKIVNFELINKLAGQFGFKTFEEESLRDLVSAVKIRDGNLILDGTKMINSIGDWDVGGTVDFLGKKLDLSVNLYLSQKYSKDLNFMDGLLQDDKGRVKLNFDVIGTYDNPSIANLSTDNSVIKDKVTDELKKGFNDLLNKFKKKK